LELIEMWQGVLVAPVVLLVIIISALIMSITSCRQQSRPFAKRRSTPMERLQTPKTPACMHLKETQCQ
jgi:hypothetical protein